MQFSSIRQQIMLFGGASLLAVTLSMVGYSAYSGKQLLHELDQLVLNNAEQTLKENLTLAAKIEAAKINIVFNQAMEVSLIYASAFSNKNPEFSRQQVNQLLQNTLTNNPNLLSIYTGWEEDAFDDDAVFNTNNNYSQSNGIYAPYINRSSSGLVKIQSLGDFYQTKLSDTGIRLSEWYLCPMESKSACIIDPASYNVQGTPTLLSSFVAPVMRNNQFQGMFGVDYSLNFLQTLATETSKNIVSGHSQVIILSPSGIISADSKNAKNIGKKLQTTALNQLIRDRQINKTIVSGDDLIATATFTTINTNTKWQVIVVAPVNIALADAQKIVKIVNTKFSDNLTGQMTIGIIAAILGLILMWFVSLSIAAPIKILVSRVKALTQSGGDLTHQIDIKRSDETGQLAQHLNTFIGDVRNVIGDIAGSVNSLTSSVHTTAKAAEQGETKIMEQRSEIEQVVTAVTEMASTAHSVSENAQETAQAVSLTQQSVDQGQTVVSANAAGLQDLTNNVLEATRIIEELEKQTDGIGSILEVIHSISEQTNLLALNAAIEAARAGEQGRGFAVVADEVRNLATKTAASTDEIQQMITGLRTNSKQAVKTMLHNIELSDKCMSHAKEAVQALDEVSVQSGKIQDMAHQIASAAEEQAAVTEEVNRSIVAINDAAQEIGQGAHLAQQESSRVFGYTNDVSNKINRFKF
ncbi:methyl-accepting chemotaxis protein [Psychromonas hadalis]|uniref:methyl-accepting chemotaxis protein n=1 Tax=Psychromonas hadalis TaxID=211669 RepID=UPI0003B3DFE9|nr:methyl-accepting chemotaxis protein [Psychromonas hadalis]